MLLTVKDACELHPMALEYSMSEQVENLSDVIGATPAIAREFFGKNYITKGMETLLNQGLRRLGGKSDQAVFELKQAMGGGKTHSMIALWPAGARFIASRRNRPGNRPRGRLRRCQTGRSRRALRLRRNVRLG
jgi:hypothetical protein